MMFISNEFRTNAEGLGIELQYSVIAAYNYILQGKRYHQPLWCILQIINTPHLSLGNTTILCIAIKFMNYTIQWDKMS